MLSTTRTLPQILANGINCIADINPIFKHFYKSYNLFEISCLTVQDHWAIDKLEAYFEVIGAILPARILHPSLYRDYRALKRLTWRQVHLGSSV